MNHQCFHLIKYPAYKIICLWWLWHFLSKEHFWEPDGKEGIVLKNWCFQTVMLEKTLESSLDSKEIKPVNPKGNQPWILIGRMLKFPYFGHLLQTPLEKTLMLRKTEGRRRKGNQRMRWLDGITNTMDMNLSKAPEGGERQAGLVCCSPRGHKELDMTGWLNKNDQKKAYTPRKVAIIILQWY